MAASTSTNPTIKFLGGGGKGATATATLDSGGRITGFTITNPGSGYTSPPIVQITDSTGVGTSATASITIGVTSIIITDPGFGYLPASPPAVNLIGGGGGSGATATAMLAAPTLGRNLISGNSGNGISVVNTGSGTGDPGSTVTIQNNYIGTDVNGLFSSVTLGNALNGVSLSGTTNVRIGVNVDPTALNPTPSPNLGERNVISGNLKAGVRIENGTLNRVLGNLVGTTATGDSDLGNGTDGIELVTSSSNTIGGVSSSAQNTITGNIGNGVLVIGNSTTSGNLVEGNILGARTAQSQTLGNAFNGVSLVNSQNNTIGGADAGAGNIITSNGFGSFARVQLNASLRPSNPFAFRSFYTDSFSSVASARSQRRKRTWPSPTSSLPPAPRAITRSSCT